MPRKVYQTDLSDAEWACLAPHVPRPRGVGRPREHPLREILNAIFYIVRGGCPWRLLPNDLPPWKTVYHYFRLWRLDGTWERIHTALRERVRIGTGREAQPGAGVIDSQTVKTTGTGGERGCTRSCWRAAAPTPSCIAASSATSRWRPPLPRPRQRPAPSSPTVEDRAPTERPARLVAGPRIGGRKGRTDANPSGSGERHDEDPDRGRRRRHCRR
jgi:transposase